MMRNINPDVKVIISTGFTADNSAYDMMRRGVVGVIEKPFDLVKLSQAVKEALQK
ncbi:hypothetical protein JXJ21_19295 [candidate division KSB1 bacterium]|nr:hypothetical protein [candidate division KSB1 bacterium]